VDDREEGLFYDIEFKEVIVNSHPHIQEADSRYMPLFPHEARLRNLTYSTEVYVMAQMKLLKREPKMSDPLAIGMADLKLNAEEEAGQF